MESGSVQRKKRIVVLAGIGTVVLLASVSLLLFFSHPRSQTVDPSAYVDLGRNATGEVTAQIDTDAILSDLHLPSPRSDPRAAERYPDVRAILDMRLFVTTADDADTMQVTLLADTDLLDRYGIRFTTLSWEQQPKGHLAESEPSAVPTLPPSAEPTETPTPSPSEAPGEGSYLTSLCDENGDGYNLRAVCERVQKERDELCRELLGDDCKAEKLQVSFSVSDGTTAFRNVYQASYRATLEIENAEPILFWFRIRIFNLKSDGGAVAFDGRVDVSMHDSETECKRAPSSAHYTTTVLSGGGVRVRGKAAFDQNGFVIFPDCPTSYRMANGIYWSPTYDALDEDSIWKLTAVDGHSLANLLRYARKEIYARYYMAFDPHSEHEFYEHYRAYAWYAERNPDLSSLMTETERANIRILREIQSLIEK